MDDESFVKALVGHLASHPDNRVRLLADPIRMDNVAADLAYDDSPLRNALRSLVELPAERVFVGQQHPSQLALDDLTQRLVNQQGIRESTARRCIWLLNAAYSGLNRDATAAHPEVCSADTALRSPSSLASPSGPALPGNRLTVPAAVAPQATLSYSTPVARHPSTTSPPDSTAANQRLAEAPGRPWWRTPLARVGAVIGSVAVVIAAVLATRGTGSPEVGGLTADTTSEPGSVLLSWTPVPGVGGYRVCRDEDSCQKVSVTSYTDTPGDTAQHNYTVAVQSGDEIGPAAMVVAAAAESSTGHSAADLIAWLPEAMVDRTSCKEVDDPPAVAVVNCDQSDQANSGPDEFWVLQFASIADLDEIYANETPGTDTPSCDDTTTTWAGTDSRDTPAGHISCYRNNNDEAMVAWTYRSRRIIVYGISKYGTTSSLYRWWRSATIPSA